MKFRVLIVDDETPARERLRSLLDEMGDVEVVGEAVNGEEAIALAYELSPDIVLLDVRMPWMDGIEAGRRLSELTEPPAVIFTTAFDEHALEAFDAKAVAYLLKPIRREKLAAAITQAVRLTKPQLAQAQAATRFTEKRSHIAVKQRDTTRLIPIADILYFAADQKYTTVKHSQGEALIEDSLRTLEDELSAEFVRIHRAALVNVQHLEAIERDAAGQYFVRLRNLPETLAVSRRMAGELRERFRL